MVRQRQVVGEFRSALAVRLSVREMIRLACLWLLAWGTAVLILRVGFAVGREYCLWGLAGLAPVAAAAAVIAARQLPRPAAIEALLDQRCACGGLLMASGEVELGAWLSAMPDLRLPAIRWRSGRAAGFLLGACAFLCAAFAVPDRYLQPLGNRRLELSQPVERLQAKIEVLQQEKILDANKAEALRQKLQQIQQEGSGQDPVKSWESLDHMERSVAKSAAESAEAGARQAEKMARAEELADALAQAGGQMDANQLAEAMQKLAQAVDQAAQENPAFSESLPEDLRSACQDGNFSPQQLAKLSATLGQCKGQSLGDLRKLAEAKLIDAEALCSCQGACQGDANGLAAALAGCAGQGTPAVEGLLDAWMAEGQPGRGGITRGRGDAPMTWSDPRRKEGVSFKEQILPPGSVSPEQSRLVGVSTADPRQGQGRGPSAGGALEAARAGAAEAHAQILLPEHRGVVQRYFERPPATTQP